MIDHETSAGAGKIGQTPRSRSFQGIAPIVASLVLLVAMVAATAALVAVQTRNASELRRVVDLRRNMTGLFASLQDAETGQRGYLLADNKAYLAPYEEAIGDIPRRLTAISAVIDPSMAEDVDELERLTADKLAELSRTVELYRRGQRDEAIDLVRTDRGRITMDQIRFVVNRLLAENDRRLIERQDEAIAAAGWLRGAVAGAVLVVIVLGALVLTDARRRNRRLEESRAALARTNHALVEAAQKRDLLEGQLRQSQKMEALGQLTGGMAHDFNNMLAIVMGNLSLMRRRLEAGEVRIERYIDHALEGAERAATLTRRLLAFARKQPLQPQPLACNRLIANMSELMRHSLGETVQIETVLAGGLWQTKADANQLESALLNLAVNARDSMPDGGRLTIETANSYLDDAYSASHDAVPAGQYVLIAMTDTGLGMTPDVASRAFDPFFTTKGVGQGTGLGLSQVYGFVKQSGGHVKIYSEPGHGTTVKIYLSRLVGLDQEADAFGTTARNLPEGSPREVILVVEDEDDVRRVAVEALRDLKYTVLHADGGQAALRLLDRHPEVSLLFTDVVMPGLDGRKLADEARRLKPDLQVLYTTGYSRNAIVHNGIVDADVRLLGKPYTLEQLALKVRQAMMDKAA